MRKLISFIFICIAAASGAEKAKKYRLSPRIISCIFAAITALCGGVATTRFPADSLLGYMQVLTTAVTLSNISIDDIMTRTVQDRYLIWMIPCTLIRVESFDDLLFRIYAMIVTGVVLIFLALVSKGEGIGGADIKLLLAASLLLGGDIIYATLIGSLASILLGPLLKTIPREQFNTIPLIPFYSLGIIVTILTT